MKPQELLIIARNDKGSVMAMKAGVEEQREADILENVYTVKTYGAHNGAEKQGGKSDSLGLILGDQMKSSILHMTICILVCIDTCILGQIPNMREKSMGTVNIKQREQERINIRE